MDGKRHRDGDQPAIVWPDGRQEWWEDGKRHRNFGLPAVVSFDGRDEEWWVEGEQRTRMEASMSFLWTQASARHRRIMVIPWYCV